MNEGRNSEIDIDIPEVYPSRQPTTTIAFKVQRDIYMYQRCNIGIEDHSRTISNQYGHMISCNRRFRGSHTASSVSCVSPLPES